VPPGYLYLYSPLLNTQYFDLQAYAKDCKHNQDFIPDLLTDDGTSTGYNTICCMVMGWHPYCRPGRPIQRTFESRWALIKRNIIFECIIICNWQTLWNIFQRIYIYVLLRNNGVIKEIVHEDDRKAAKIPLMIYYAKWNECIVLISPREKMGQRSINDCWSCTSCNYKVIWSLLYIIKVSDAYISQENATRSWLYPGNGHQRSINDIWSCKYGKYCVIWLSLDIIKVLAAFTGKWESDTLPAPSWKWASM